MRFSASPRRTALVVSAGLFVRSLANAQRIDLGFDGEPLMVLGMNAGTLKNGLPLTMNW